MKKGDDEPFSFDTNRYKSSIDEVKSLNINPIDYLSVSCKNSITEKDSNFYRPKIMNDKHLRIHPSIPFIIKSETIEKFDIDTLFFIFFVQQEAYLQLLVARRLRSLKWMFSKRYQTWFQLVGNPKNQTNDFIEGTFYFFDFEKEWQIRTKRDFKFELVYLENDY